MARVTVGRQLAAGNPGEGQLALHMVGGRLNAEPGVRRSGGTGCGPVLEGGLQPEAALAGAGQTAFLLAAAGQEHLAVLVPGQRTLGVREQVDAWGPAARHQQGVAGDGLRTPDLAAGGHRIDPHRRDAQPALGAGDGPADQRPDAQGVGGSRQLGRNGAADIDDGRDLNPRLREVEGGMPGAVMGGDDHHPVADLDAVAVQVGARGPGQHHARPVVAGEHQRLFDGALGQHHLLGPDLPHPLARGTLRHHAQMVGQPLAQADEILVVIADGRGARQHRDVRHRRQRGAGVFQPVPGQLPVDLGIRFGQQRAADFRLLVAQDDGRAAATRLQRRGEAGGTATDDQHVAMGEAAGVGVGIGGARRLAQAGGAADERLVDLVPEALRPHEGLIVEAGREQHVERVVHRADVAGQRRPAVLALGLQPVEDLQHRRPRVRLEPPVAAVGSDQCVRLFRPGGQEAARPVILEGPPDEMDAVRQERGRQGVALVAGEVRAVEREAHRAAAVDPALACNAEIAHGRASSALVAARVAAPAAALAASAISSSLGRGAPAL